MDIKVQADYKRIDADNIKQFGKAGTDCGDLNLYRCVICGKEACIANSMSARGHRLIHISCMEKAFEYDIVKALRWMEEE